MTQESAPVIVQNISITSASNGDDLTPFRTLNEEWIRRFFALEDKDREILGNPQKHILQKGGAIFLGWYQQECVACVALIPMQNGVFELSKMAVKPELRGSGVGRHLLIHAISKAKAMNATSLFLGSSTKLKNAVHLYESVGFRHVPQELLPPNPYTRADVFMEMTL